MENNQTNKVAAEQKKRKRKIITWVLIVALVLMLAVMPVLAAKNEAANEQTASILTGEVTTGSIDSLIIGGGRLASEAAVKLTIPEEVKLVEYLVGNGDTVSEGDPIARVDRVSVMTAITGVQEALDTLSEKILDEESENGTTTVKASAGGTVKAVYAQPGDAAMDVMLEHGALAVVSLDDRMAVKIPVQSRLDIGDSVRVVLPEDVEISGRVERNLEGVLTVTVEDDDYPVGLEATVLTESGEPLGQGNLYIFNQWNATAYSGTVTSVLVKENGVLRSGQDMIRLEDSGYSAEFQLLIDRRQEYEERMQELFQMYRTEMLTAPCAGIVSGVEKDGAFLLSGEGEGVVLNLLANLVGGRADLFEVHGVRVETVCDNSMQLLMDPDRFWAEDLSRLSSMAVNSENMTLSWDYTGDVTVYTQTEDGVLRVDGEARVGDILLAVGDAEQVLWFVRPEGKQGSAAAAQMPSVHRLSAETEPEIQLHISSNQAIARESFSAELTALQGKQELEGTWSIDYSVSDGWLGVSENILFGTPAEAGVYSVTVGFVPKGTETTIVETFQITVATPVIPQYTAIPAKVIGIGDGVLLVKQSEETFEVADPENIPPMVPDEEKMTVPASYLSNLVKSEEIAEGDILLLVLDQQGELFRYEHLSERFPGESGMEGSKPGMNGGIMSGGFGGGMPGMSGGMQQQEEELYSLEKLTVASVTSQESMTVEITVDERDIRNIFMGQAAVVTVDALAGETFDAKVSKIANTGENEGGSSKFSVELSLEKSGDMLPGMMASARIVLDTAENVLCIPVAALSEAHGKTVVYTAYDEKEETLGAPVEVTVGAADADSVQILSGLAAGDTFYYAYYDTPERVGMPDMGMRPFG